LGTTREVVDVVEAAVIAEALLRPRQPDDVERLVEARAVVGQRHAEPVELGGNRAAADAELQPAARQQVRRRRLLGAAQRMVQGQQRHRGADADAPRALGDDRHRHERAGQQREHAAEV
jgi:hypothetical protein